VTVAPIAAESRPEWASWVTPKGLRSTPVHRWFVFPHSFTPELVGALIAEWGLTRADVIVDPFVGAGTTILAAKEHGVRSIGFDLSPLAVLASQVKVAPHSADRLTEHWDELRSTVRDLGALDVSTFPSLVRRALPPSRLEAFARWRLAIEHLDARSAERDFFLLALLAVLPEFSRAIATGGWLSWRQGGRQAKSLDGAMTARVELMISDLQSAPKQSGTWRAELADARSLPCREGDCSAAITSPPYPNRHDYSRVFGVELMFAFSDWEGTRALRYQSLHSHPEARPYRPALADKYVAPARLAKLLNVIASKAADKRIPRMVSGYFLDTYLYLSELRRCCSAGAPVACVVGNAQYYGEVVPVDELVAEIGERVGLRAERLVAVRHRGNSAQQMAIYGRRPSRESIVEFRVSD
jgi:DNA methylase